MQRKRNKLNQKLDRAYPFTDWINDILTIAQNAPSKTYAEKIDSTWQDWDLDEITLMEDVLVQKMDKLFNNNKKRLGE